MQIFRILAGYSYGRADVVRRYMSKKKTAEMEKEKQYFLYGKKNDDGNTECEGAIARGVSKENALKIFDEMSEFAKYAFNKSHACAYSVIAYRTAYLKCYYPREYMSALITSVLDNESKLVSYISELSNHGIKVLAPSVNDSEIDFAVDGENIRFGLLAIKNIGRNVLERIIEEREKNGKYKSLEDFLSRVCDKDVYEKVIENLIKSGACDCFGKKRSQLLAVFPSAFRSLAKIRSTDVKGQLDIFSQLSGEESPSRLVIEYPDLPELSLMERLVMEKEVAGIYFSGHPMLDYSEYSKKIGASSISAILSSFGEDGTCEYSDGQNVMVTGMLKSVRAKQTKSGSKMAFVQCDDGTGIFEIVVFPKKYETFNNIIKTGAIAGFFGKISVKEARDENGEEISLILENVVPIYKNSELENTPANSGTQKEISNNPNEPYVPGRKVELQGKSLYLKVKNENCDELKKAVNLCEIFRDGKTPVFVLFENTGRLSKLNFTISLNDTFIALQKRYLGESNVVIKEKS